MKTKTLDLADLLSKADMMSSHEHDPSLGQRRTHKYTNRYWNGNSWVYEYPGDEGKGSPNAAPSSGPPNSGGGGGEDKGGPGQQAGMGEPQEDEEMPSAAPSSPASPPAASPGSPSGGGGIKPVDASLQQWQTEQLSLLDQLQQMLQQQGQDVTIVSYAKDAVAKITQLMQIPEFDKVMESLGFQQYIADRVISHNPGQQVTAKSLEEEAIKLIAKELR